MLCSLCLCLKYNSTLCIIHVRRILVSFYVFHVYKRIIKVVENIMFYGKKYFDPTTNTILQAKSTFTSTYV